MEGWSHPELGRRFDRSESWSKSIVSRGLARLRLELDETLNEPQSHAAPCRPVTRTSPQTAGSTTDRRPVATHQRRARPQSAPAHRPPHRTTALASGFPPYVERRGGTRNE